MRNVSLKAVLLSTLAVFALDLVVGISLGFLLGAHIYREGMTADETSKAIAALAMSLPNLLAGMVLGTITTIFGGYLAARIAKKAPYLNSGIVGVIGLLLGIMFSRGYPLWFNLTSFLIIVPAALLGGHIGRERPKVPA